MKAMQKLDQKNLNTQVMWLFQQLLNVRFGI